MSWSRFEPGFSRHIKRVKGGPVASWLWACSVDHCTVYRTDGFLDAAAVPTLDPAIRGPQLKRCVEILVAVKSWVPVEGGYMVHGYLDCNVTAERVEKDRQAARDRYQRWQDNKRRSNDAATPLETPLQQRSPTETQRDSPHGLSVGLSVGHSPDRVREPRARARARERRDPEEQHHLGPDNGAGFRELRRRGPDPFEEDLDP
jgi:hypothetical protein